MLGGVAPKIKPGTTGHILTSNVQYARLDVHIFKWKTKLNLKEGEDLIRSPVYWTAQILPHGRTCWVIELNPNFTNSEGTRYLSLHVRFLGCENQEHVLELNGRFSLNPGPPDPVYFKEFDSPITVNLSTPRLGFDEFIELYRVISPQGNPDGVLQFMINLSITTYSQTSDALALQLPFLQKNAQTVGDKSTINSSAPKEVTLTHGKTVIKADAQLLSHHSPVLRYAFQENGLDFDFDMSNFCKSMNQVLLLIAFCNENEGDMLPRLKRLGQIYKLLQLADNLQIERLKTFCQKLYLEKLTVAEFGKAWENVMISDDGLFDKSQASPIMIKFLLSNITQLMKHETFTTSYKKNKISYDVYLTSYMRKFAQDFS